VPAKEAPELDVAGQAPFRVMVKRWAQLDSNQRLLVCKTSAIKALRAPMTCANTCRYSRPDEIWARIRHGSQESADDRLEASVIERLTHDSHITQVLGKAGGGRVCGGPVAARSSRAGRTSRAAAARCAFRDRTTCADHDTELTLMIEPSLRAVRQQDRVVAAADGAGRLEEEPGVSAGFADGNDRPVAEFADVRVEVRGDGEHLRAVAHVILYRSSVVGLAANAAAGAQAAKAVARGHEQA
jgi:hypothetical protein